MSKNKQDKAFDYEHGQYICHVYATIPDGDMHMLESLIEAIQAEQDQTRAPWRPIYTKNQTGARGSIDEKLHVTLLRGHRAVHYHQIRAMVERIRADCQTLQPIRLLLDQLRIFSNLENTKKFLCLAHGQLESAEQFGRQNPLAELKRTVRSIVNEYAIRLTDEDETEDTVAHCSLMLKDNEHCDEEEEGSKLLQAVEDIVNLRLDEYPSCFLNVETVCVKIGKVTYEIHLGG